jgi:divalent metal cation (Fe/Co/Zn/Cd) transporter
MDKKSGDFQRFPLGAVAAESVGVVVFSTLEVVFAVELTAYALYSIVTRLVSQTQPSPLTLDFISLAFILVTIIVKAGLVAFFQQLKSVDSIAEAYYQVETPALQQQAS